MGRRSIGFVELAFYSICNDRGGVSVVPDRLPHTFRCNVTFSTSSVRKFISRARSSLFLHPSPRALTILP